MFDSIRKKIEDAKNSVERAVPDEIEDLAQEAKNRMNGLKNQARKFWQTKKYEGVL